MYNKTTIKFVFCDIRNNQGLGKYNQPRPPASADYTCLELDYSGYHKSLIQLLFIINVFYLPFLNGKVALGFIAKSFLESNIWLFPRRCFRRFL